jgi:hypothetical protein
MIDVMSTRWEAATPHRCPCTTYFFFVFFAIFFFLAILSVTSFRATIVEYTKARYFRPFFFFFAAFRFFMGSVHPLPAAAVSTPSPRA